MGRTYEPLWLYSEVALVYLLYSTVLTFIQRAWEKRLNTYNTRGGDAVVKEKEGV